MGYLRLSEETSLLWDEIIGHTYSFKWKAKYIKILEKIKLFEMKKFYKERVIGKEAKWISIQLFNQKAKENKNKNLGHRVVVQQTGDNQHDVLYFNQTKDLQQLGYAEYFDVY